MSRPDEATETQKWVLAAIMASVVSRGYPPSYSDLCEHFGWRSQNAAAQHLDALEHKGYIEVDRRPAIVSRSRRSRRGLRVLKDEDGWPVRLRYERTEE